MIETVFYTITILFAVFSMWKFDSVIYLNHRSFFRMFFVLCGLHFLGHILHTLIIPAIFPTWTIPDPVKILDMLGEGPINLFRVWHEDVIYVWPSLILTSLGHKKMSWAVLILTLPSFVSGHMYQGVIGYLSITGPLLARYLGLRYGAVTVMFLHILHDMLIHFRLESMI